MEGNGTQSVAPTEVQSESIGFKITKICFYVIILSASTFGNSMVAHIICTTRKMRNASNCLILNLAICDLVTPLISIIFDFVLEEHDYHWLYGSFMCKILWPAATYFTTASSLTLAVISLDRYRMIMHPFIPRLSSKQTCILICTVHLFSLIAVVPYVHFLGLKDGSCEEQWPEFKYRQGYTLFLFLVQYGLPLTFMVVMYSLALRELYNTSGRVRGSFISNREPQMGQKRDKSMDQTGRKISYQKLKALLSKRIWNTQNGQAMKMFIVVVTVFAICMFPNQVVWLWADYGGGTSNPNFSQISIVCWLFTYANSVVNPIIFGVFSKDFNRGFAKIFGKFICCESLAGKCDVERAQSVKTATESLEAEANNEDTSERKKGIGNIFLPKEKNLKNKLKIASRNLQSEAEPQRKPSMESTTHASPSNEETNDVKRNSIPLTKSVMDQNPEEESSLLIDYLKKPSVQASNAINVFEQKKMEIALSSSPETNC